MHGLEFLRLILPRQGLYVGFARKGQARRTDYFTTTQELYDWVIHWSNKGFDAYHACASFKDAMRQGMREQTNILFLRAFRMDIDTQESHKNAKYKDWQEALYAVVAFCHAAGLPTPLCVASGGGLHIYWPLVDELGLEEWKTYSFALKSCCLHFELVADSVLTSNGSAILRTPGTRHQMSGRTVECADAIEPYRLEDFAGLKEFMDGPPRTFKTRPGEAITSRLGAAGLGGIERHPADSEAVAAGCLQAKSVLESPSSYGEPLHYVIAGVFANCANGEEFYANRLDEEWQEEGRRKVQQWKAKTTGPPYCATIRDKNPQGCKGCKYEKEENFSPVFIKSETKVNGHTVSFAPASDIVLPNDSWAWGPQGQLVFKTSTRGEVLETIVSEHSIHLSDIHRSESDNSTLYTFRQYLPHQGWTPITISAGTAVGSMCLSSVAEQGGVVREPVLFHRYVHDAVDMWHKDNKMSLAYEQCGWKADNKAFLTGTQYITANAIIEVIGDHDVTERGKYLRPAQGGSVQGWVSCVNKLMAEKREAVEFALLCSFAAPLMAFQAKNEGGFILSLVNRGSGSGKSMTLKLMESVWGQHEGCSVEKKDTASSKGLFMATLCNLPITFDELATIYNDANPDALRDLVEVFSQGRDKRRAKVHGIGLQSAPGIWRTIMAAASNLSLVDLIETGDKKGIDAAAYRIIELIVDFAVHLDISRGNALEFELFENAGHAGPAFIQYVLQNMDHVIRDLRDVTQAIWQAGSFRAEHRFWVNGLSACLVAGYIAKAIDLIHFDPQETIDYVMHKLGMRALDKLSAEKVLPGAIEIFGNFVHGHLRNTLVVHNSFKPGDRPVPAIREPSLEMLIRYETETGRFCVNYMAFKRWLVQHGYPYLDTVHQLQNLTIVKTEKRAVTLGAGTVLASVPIICTEFDMLHPAVSGIARMVEEALIGEKAHVQSTTR